MYYRWWRAAKPTDKLIPAGAARRANIRGDFWTGEPQACYDVKRCIIRQSVAIAQHIKAQDSTDSTAYQSTGQH